MALPRKLKNLNLFEDGVSYLGQVDSATLPPLKRKMEEYRGGGMNAPVKVDMGMEGLDFEWTCAGYMREVLSSFGAADASAVQLRFAGAYQREDGSGVDAVEIVVRGRHEEITRGDAKTGEKTETKIKTACAYCKETLNGEVLLEVDILNMIEIVDGVDRLAEQRAALGI